MVQAAGVTKPWLVRMGRSGVDCEGREGGKVDGEGGTIRLSVENSVFTSHQLFTFSTPTPFFLLPARALLTKQFTKRW